MLQIFATLIIALFFYWLVSRMIKEMMAEKIEDSEIKIGSLENKIDELYTIIYKLGNTIEVVWPAGKSEVAPQKKQRDPNSAGALKARMYREKKRSQEFKSNQSKMMKASWEKRRQEDLKASSSEKKQPQ